MSFATRLADLLRGEFGHARTEPADKAPDGDSHLAAAALLVHVARVDGRLDGPERVALVVLLADRFGLRDETASALVNRADAVDREVDDVSDLIEMLGHETDASDRERLLAMAYRVAAADGVVGEFEADLVWRVGHLLRLDEGAIDRIRRDALGPDPGRADAAGS